MLYKPQKTIFIFVLLCCAALRVYLKLFVVDPMSGFYEGDELVVAIFRLVLTAGVLGLLVLGCLPKLAQPSLQLNPLARLSAVLTGLLSAVVCVLSLSGRLASFFTLDTRHGAVAMLASLVLSALGGLCLIVAPFVTAVVFVLIGLRGKNGTLRLNPVLMLAPLCWQVAVLLTNFMDYTAMRYVSDQKLSVVMLILGVPFLLAQGRMVGGVDPEKGVRQLVGFGLAFSVTAVTVSLGMAAACFAGSGLEIAFSLPEALLYLCMGVYAGAAAFSVHGLKA